MNLNINVGVDSPAFILWDGTTARTRDIRGFNAYGLVFEVIGAISTDAVFELQAAPPDAITPCIAGEFAPVKEPTICTIPTQYSENVILTIPAGTPVGSYCAGTTACFPGAFIKLIAVSGDTKNVNAVVVFNGPQA